MDLLYGVGIFAVVYFDLSQFRPLIDGRSANTALDTVQRSKDSSWQTLSFRIRHLHQTTLFEVHRRRCLSSVLILVSKNMKSCKTAFTLSVFLYISPGKKLGAIRHALDPMMSLVGRYRLTQKLKRKKLFMKTT